MTKKVIALKDRRPPDKKSIKLVMLGNDIDLLIKRAVQDDLKAKEIVMVLANRLASFLARFKEKDRLYVIVKDYIKERAGITK